MQYDEKPCGKRICTQMGYRHANIKISCIYLLSSTLDLPTALPSIEGSTHAGSSRYG